MAVAVAVRDSKDPELTEEEPPGPPAYQQEQLRIDQAPVSALVCRHGDVWAARALAGPVSVTVVGRGVGLGSVRLIRVTGLEPYWRAREQMIARLGGLRHAVLGHNVPSLPAQQAWARHWAQGMFPAGHRPEDLAPHLAAGKPLTSWLAAWPAWTRRS